MQRNVLGLLVWVAIGMSQTASSAEVYRWIDSKGVAHYSQLPPPAGEGNYGRINTAFTPAEQALIAKAEKEAEEHRLAMAAAASSAHKNSAAQRACQSLQKDKEAYLKRRIGEEYLSSRKACDLSFVSVSSQKDRDSCYNHAQQEMEEQLGNLPSLVLCKD